VKEYITAKSGYISAINIIQYKIMVDGIYKSLYIYVGKEKESNKSKYVKRELNT